MPFRRARVRHRLDDLIFGREWRGAALGFGANAAIGRDPMRSTALRGSEKPRVTAQC
jgi:hypothetical protein